MATGITDYKTFQNFRIPLADFRHLCQHLNLPEPAKASRMGRGEVSALFLLEFDDAPPHVLKVFVRPQGQTQMETGLKIARQILRVACVSSPEWLYASSADEFIPYPYAILEYAAGQDGDTLWKTLDLPQKVQLVVACAETLKALHSSRLSVDGPGDLQEWISKEISVLPKQIEVLRDQGWFRRELLDTAEVASQNWPAKPLAGSSLSFVHYDFQLHNLRVDSSTLGITAVLDFDNATMAPAFTDSRDLTVSVLMESPELYTAFWRAYGEISEQEWRVLQLHCLSRILGVMASYYGPVGFLSELTVERLLRGEHFGWGC